MDAKSKSLIIVGVAIALLLSACGEKATTIPLTATPIPSFTPTRTPIFTHALTSTVTPIPTSTHTPMPTLGIGSTWIRPADSMVMVYVPEGEFKMGSNQSVYEKPIHTVYLDAFWIDQTEVTNAMYALCVQAGVCQLPSKNSSYTHGSFYGDSKYDNYPVGWVHWNDANTYCQWAGAHLTTEAEWEKAARGTDRRTYPWGNWPPNCSLANYSEECKGDTTAVGSYPSGASPYGALDMAGNVWEWVADWYSDIYYASSPDSNPIGPSSGIYRVLRGGAWNENENYARSANRHRGADPSASGSNLGFRCARSAK